MADRITETIESLCACMDIGVMWPGLYPRYFNPSYPDGSLDIRDAISWGHGCDSFAILKAEEGKNASR